MKQILNIFILTIAVIGLTVSGAFAQQDKVKSQTELQKEVFREIITLPYYGVFDNIKFKLVGDRVVLLGAVTKPTLKESAENVVEDIKGINEVENNIEVLPLSRFDDTIRYRTWQTIANRGSLYRYLTGANPSIKIIVNDGRISLEGFVNSKADADLAYLAARQVPGTFAVENNLQVVVSEPQ